jgi:hypothetical protein
MRASPRTFLLGFFGGLWLALSASCGPTGPSEKACPADCAGCCSDQGDCLAGTAVFECGTGGAACVACEANQVCQAGACAPFANGDYDASFPDAPDASVNPDAGVFMPGDAGTMTQDAGMTDAGPMMVSYSAQVQPIFDSRCDACHSWTYDNTVGVNGRIAPGNLNASSIYTRTLSGDMPRQGGPLTSSQQLILRDWILNGAPRN